MTVREKVFLLVAGKSRLITTIVFVLCLYCFTCIDKFSNRAKVEEETIASGDLDGSVAAEDYVQDNSLGVPDRLASLGLPFHSLFLPDQSAINYTLIESKRGDTREAAVYAFVVSEDETKEQTPGSQIALTLASGLRKANWLSRDVYILMVPKAATAFGYGVRAWLEDFYRSNVSSLESERPHIRSAFAVDLTGPGGSSVLIEAEGINGVLSNQDVSNVLFDIADASATGLRLTVRPVFHSIAFSAMNGAVHSLHAAFQDYAIPSVSLRRDPFSEPFGDGPSVLSVAQAVGKHVRSLTALSHQFHHSTSFFLYTGFGKEASLGFIVPVLVGIFSPLFPGLLGLHVNNEPVWVVNSFVAIVLAAVLGVGAVALASVLSLYDNQASACTNVTSESATISPMVLVFVLIASFIHFKLVQTLERKAKCDAGSALKAAAQQIYSLLLTMLLLFHYSGAVLSTAFVVPALTLVSPIRGASLAKKLVSILVLLTLWNLFIGLTIGAYFIPTPDNFVANIVSSLHRGFGRSTLAMKLPIHFFSFLSNLSSGKSPHWKSLSQLSQEYFCVRGLAIVNFLLVIFPALLLSTEIALARAVSHSHHKPQETIPHTFKSNMIKKVVLISAIGTVFVAYSLMEWF